MDLALLFSEITNDPASVGYGPHNAAGWDEKIAELLNAKTIDSYRVVPSRELLEWSASNSRFAKLLAGQESSVPAAIRSICRAAELLITRTDTSLDLAKPSISGMVAALENGGILDAGDVLSLKQVSAGKISRCQEIHRSSGHADWRSMIASAADVANAMGRK